MKTDCSRYKLSKWMLNPIVRSAMVTFIDIVIILKNNYQSHDFVVCLPHCTVWTGDWSVQSVCLILWMIWYLSMIGRLCMIKFIRFLKFYHDERRDESEIIWWWSLMNNVEQCWRRESLERNNGKLYKNLYMKTLCQAVLRSTRSKCTTGVELVDKYNFFKNYNFKIEFKMASK